MAEIKIEKKKPIWPWILVVLIILAAVYFFWANNDNDLDSKDDGIERDTISQIDEPYLNEEMTTTYLYSGTYGNVRDEQAMADYFVFVDSLETDVTDKSFYRNGFFKLITATKRQAELDSVDVSANINAAMENTEKLTNTITSNTKANEVKKAANEISKALKTIQEEEYKNLANEAKEIEEAVTQIEGTQTLETQSSKIETFFDKTAGLLQKMNERNKNENNQ